MHVLPKKPRRFTPAQGATICALGLVVGLGAWQVALVVQPLLLQLLLFVFAWFALWFFPHDLAHHIVGKIVGIRFQYYYLGKSPIRKLKLPLVSQVMRMLPVLGLKIDKGSLANVSSRARRWMHASGAIASMTIPWIIVPSSLTVKPYWVGIFITLLVSGYVLFTIYFSFKTSDLYRARTSG